MRAPCSEASLGTMQPSRRTFRVTLALAGSQELGAVGSRRNGSGCSRADGPGPPPAAAGAGPPTSAAIELLWLQPHCDPMLVSAAAQPVSCCAAHELIDRRQVGWKTHNVYFNCPRTAKESSIRGQRHAQM
jgi:hypothetical protein